MEDEKTSKEDINTIIYVGFVFFGALICGMSIYALTQVTKTKAPIIINVGWNILLNIGACVMTAGIYMFICTGYTMGCVYDQHMERYFWLFLAISIILVVIAGMILHEYMSGRPSEYENSDSKNKELIATILSVGCVMFIVCIAGISKNIQNIHKGVVINSDI